MQAIKTSGRKPPSGPEKTHFRAFDPWLAAILVLGAFLIFTSLGQRPLWQDEAETACLAVNVLDRGLPYAYDGVNFVSQEERREFNADDGYLWRWSPWLQIYLSAAGMAAGGKSAAADRFPFALAGLGCIFLTYLIIKKKFNDPVWARLSALLLTLSVPFLLFARQGRYYSAGTLLVLVCLYAFLSDWQNKWGPFWTVVLSMVLLFHANYLLLLSFAPCALVAAFMVYRERLPLKRLALLTALSAALIAPAIPLYRVGRQSGMFNVLLIPENLMLYFADLIMFMIPLPVLAALAWRWRGFFLFRGRPESEKERFVLFSVLIIVGNLLILALIPQRFHRYIVHLYPLCAIALSWAALRLWRFSRSSAVIFFLLVSLTNWLNIYPLERLKLNNRPWQNDFRMLTSINIPLRLYLNEILCGYPDVNAHIVEFFKTHARPGQTILAEYADMPLQFYTGLRVIGGLQGDIDPAERPDWILERRVVRVNRDRVLFGARAFTSTLDLDKDYERIDLPWPDETFGNRAAPDEHAFIPAEPPAVPLRVYRKKGGA